MVTTAGERPTAGLIERTLERRATAARARLAKGIETVRKLVEHVPESPGRLLFVATELVRASLVMNGDAVELECSRAALDAVRSALDHATTEPQPATVREGAGEEKTNRQRLVSAMDLVEEAADGLNTDGYACSSCGLTVRENFAENQAAESLGGVFTKLRRTVENRELHRWLDGPQAAPASAESEDSEDE